MATTPPTKEERDANLDKLLSAVQEWSNKEVTRLENEVKYMRAILKGRGAQATGTRNLAKASALVVDEIDAFISA